MYFLHFVSQRRSHWSLWDYWERVHSWWPDHCQRSSWVPEISGWASCHCVPAFLQYCPEACGHPVQHSENALNWCGQDSKNHIKIQEFGAKSKNTVLFVLYSSLFFSHLDYIPILHAKQEQVNYNLHYLCEFFSGNWFLFIHGVIFYHWNCDILFYYSTLLLCIELEDLEGFYKFVLYNFFFLFKLMCYVLWFVLYIFI